MTYYHISKVLAPLVIKVMQTKITLIYHHTLVTKAIAMMRYLTTNFEQDAWTGAILMYC